MEINKKLTQKKAVVLESEEEAELIIDMDKRNESDGPDTVAVSADANINPWMRQPESTSNDNATTLKEVESEDEMLTESLVRKKTLQEYSQEADGEPKSQPKRPTECAKKQAPQSKPAEVDPTKFISLKTKKLESREPDLSKVDDEVLADDVDDDQEQAEKSRYMTIAEAFADDDVINEFK